MAQQKVWNFSATPVRKPLLGSSWKEQQIEKYCFKRETASWWSLRIRL